MDQQKINKLSKLSKLMKYNITLNKIDYAIFYDEKEITKNFKSLSRLQTKKIKFIFPVKSFPAENILKIANKHFEGFDISNSLEYELIKNLVSEKKIIWNSCPYNLENSVGIQDINTPQDVRNLDVSLRIKADEFNGYKSRFGIEPHLINDILATNSKINKLHIHMGGEQNTVRSYRLAIDFILGNLEKVNLTKEFTINFGGGFGNFEIHQIEEVVSYAKKKLLNHTIIFEPGRWLTKNAGYAYTKLLGRSKTVDGTNLIMALSPSCHLKWFRGKFEVYFEKNNEKKIDEVTKVKLCGPTCFENDTLAELDVMNMGEGRDNYCLINNVSGYSYAWNTSFNGVEKAKVIFLKGAM